MDEQKDGQTERQTELSKVSCKLTIERLTFAISTCHKNTGRGRIEN